MFIGALVSTSPTFSQRVRPRLGFHFGLCVLKCLGLYSLLQSSASRFYCHVMQQLDQRLGFHITQCLVQCFSRNLFYRVSQSMKSCLRFYIHQCCRLVSRLSRLLACQPQHEMVPGLFYQPVCFLVSRALRLVACQCVGNTFSLHWRKRVRQRV